MVVGFTRLIFSTNFPALLMNICKKLYYYGNLCETFYVTIFVSLKEMFWKWLTFIVKSALRVIVWFTWSDEDLFNWTKNEKILSAKTLISRIWSSKRNHVLINSIYSSQKISLIIAMLTTLFNGSFIRLPKKFFLRKQPIPKIFPFIMRMKRNPFVPRLPPAYILICTISNENGIIIVIPRQLHA